jgi:hypothetical protein
MGYEQATIKVEKEQEFQGLKSEIDSALTPERVEKFLKRVASRGIRIRDFDSVLARNVLEDVNGSAKRSASGLYGALSVTDQAQLREFYLFRIEEVDTKLRTKYHKIYQYY